MNNGNGKIDIWKIMTAIIIPVIFFMGSNLIASDKESRQRDIHLEEKLTQCVSEQKDVNKDILVALAEIKTDLKYIRREVDNGGRVVGRETQKRD